MNNTIILSACIKPIVNKIKSSYKSLILIFYTINMTLKKYIYFKS